MTCEQAELRMAELLAGEIAAEDRSLLEKHLLDCAACRGDFEFARAGARIEWADVAVPKEVVEATLASFREPAPVVRLLRWATAAAAVFGLAALLIASSRTTKREDPPAPVAVRTQMLATMQDAAVGAMVCKDEDGRPVGELGLKSHEVSVEILDGIAKTTVEENFENHTDRRLEGTFNFPLPSDASISRLALEVNGKIEEGTCLERERAREVFEGIVRRMQDPALLEWQPGGFFKCRVFPIEPRATKRVIVAYTQALPCFQGKMTYVYPLASEKTRTHAPEEVRIGVQARFSGALAKIESPSHHLEVQRKNPNEASMNFRAAHYRPNNDFVVTMEPGPEEVRVVSHKTDGEDGYFACFATPQGGGERKAANYAFVLDASASTSAPRLEVARRLVRAMMERRIDGDRFEVLAHNIEVERSGNVDLRAANTFMDRLQPIGGSDVLKALQAVGGDAEVVYIGKGAPTFGEAESSKILEAMKGRRIRTIAVGSDANVGLLERLGGMMRVSPNDDVAKRIAEIAATLGAPVLSDVKIDGGDAVYDVVGVRDLFYGERLIVSGRYRGPASKLVITGSGYRREVDVAFPPKEEGNNYVRRLWAQRKVGDLLAQGPAKKAEVTDLGVKYQIMTPYTSFLVLETEQMWKDHQLKREVQKQDEVLGKGDDGKKRMAEAEASAHEVVTKRIATMRIAEFLQQSYAAWDGRQYDRTMKLCDEILKIDPHYQIAKDLKDGAEKERHRTPYQDLMTPKVKQWKALTQAGNEPVIPMSQTVRFPSREEWGNIVKSFDRTLLPGQTPQEQQRQFESQRHHEQAMEFRYAYEWEKAKAEAAKALDCWQENTEAHKFRDQLAVDEFRVTMEQANIEITKHVRDGHRYLNARMYDQAQKEFENAEFKILNLPPGQKALYDLLPTINESITRSRSGRILEERRTEEEKKRMAGTEAAGHELPRPTPDSKKPEVVKTPPPPTPTVVPPAPAKNPVTAPFEPAPTVKPPPPDVTKPTVIERLADPDTTTSSLVLRTTPRAEEFYKLAERRFQAGEYEKSVEMSVKSLEADPNYAPARALYTENAFILGKGKATPATGEYDNLMMSALVRLQPGQIPELFSMDNGELPRGFSTQDSARLEGYFAWPNDIKKQSELLEIVTSVTAPGAPITDALPSAFEPDMSVFFPQVQLEEGQMKELSGKLGRRDAFTKTKFRSQGETRQPKGLSEMTEELSGEDQALRDRLRTARVTVDMQNAPITAIIDHLRETTGLNIHVSGIDTPDADLVTLRTKDVPVEQALRQLLEPRGKAVQVRDGVVLITPMIQQGGNVNVAPKKAVDARVNAVDPASGLVVISVGKDDGVLEGDEFSVYRSGEFVSKIVLDRSDRKWAAGKVVLKKGDPRVGDDVSNRIFVQGGWQAGDLAACTIPTMAMVVVAAREDGSQVSLSADNFPAAVNQLYAVIRGGKFVAMIRADRVTGKQVDAKVVQSLAVGRILPGDAAVYVADPKGYLAALPAGVRMDLASRASQQAIRAKMGLKE